MQVLGKNFWPAECQECEVTLEKVLIICDQENLRQLKDAIKKNGLSNVLDVFLSSKAHEDIPPPSDCLGDKDRAEGHFNCPGKALRTVFNAGPISCKELCRHFAVFAGGRYLEFCGMWEQA